MLIRYCTLVALTLISGLAAAACGSDDESGGTSQAQQSEQAFLEAMVPHHESAVEMAMVAKRRAQHDEIEVLASEIVTAQEFEIEQMKEIHERLFGAALQPDDGAHAALGLSADQAGMAHGMEAMDELEKAEPFDRAFIDEMVPHHQGAIRMARAVLDQSEDSELRKLAEAIVSDQSREIKEMNEWRVAWHGKASPAGGVPGASSESSGEMEEQMDEAHEGH